MQPAPPPPAAWPWRNVAILVLAQGLIGAQMSMQFLMGGLAGQTLAPNPCLATLPLSLMILGSTLAARPLAGVMATHGRRTGFILACALAATGAALSIAGLRAGSFALFSAGTALCGVYMAAQGFYRFAATDALPPELHGRAISYVQAGGLLSAITGPVLVARAADAAAIPFLGGYLVILAINLAGPLLLAMLAPTPRRAAPASGTAAPAGEGWRALARRPVLVVAMICGMVAYALMNLVMTSTPLAMVGCGFSNDTVATVVSAHILAMYAPSFFTGHLIARFGAVRIVATGLAILAAAGGTALAGIELGHFTLALVLLGIGWNFGFIGATALLTQNQPAEGRERVQGINDMVVFGGVFFASLGSGGLLNCTGGGTIAGWQAVNLAMVPFLALAGGALIWLTLRPRAA